MTAPKYTYAIYSCEPLNRYNRHITEERKVQGGFKTAGEAMDAIPALRQPERSYTVGEE